MYINQEAVETKRRAVTHSLAQNVVTVRIGPSECPWLLWYFYRYPESPTKIWGLLLPIMFVIFKMFPFMFPVVPSVTIKIYEHNVSVII